MVDQKQINNARFDAMLRLAAVEAHKRDMAELPSDEQIQKTHTFSERHEKRMAKLFAKDRRKEAFAKVRKPAYRTAAAILIGMATLFGALMFNDDIRASVVRVITEWFEQFTRFTFTGNNSNEYIEIDLSSEWLPTYLPEGFVETDYFQAGSMKIIDFANQDGIEITFWQSSSPATVETDNEYRVHQTFTHDGVVYHAFISDNEDDMTTIIWERDGFAFFINSTLDYQKLLEMAFSVERIAR